MLVLHIEVNAPEATAQAVKEQLAMVCEQFGDVRVVSVNATPDRQPEQMRMWSGNARW